MVMKHMHNNIIEDLILKIQEVEHDNTLELFLPGLRCKFIRPQELIFQIFFKKIYKYTPRGRDKETYLILMNTTVISIWGNIRTITQLNIIV